MGVLSRPAKKEEGDEFLFYANSKQGNRIMYKYPDADGGGDGDGGSTGISVGYSYSRKTTRRPFHRKSSATTGKWLCYEGNFIEIFLLTKRLLSQTMSKREREEEE